MWKAALAGIVMLATPGFVAVASAEMPDSERSVRGQSQPSSGAIASGIARAKAALRLTPEQEKHWPRLEAALRSALRDSDKSADAVDRGFLRRVGSRATDMVYSAAAVNRVVAAAQPLMKSLDQDQKRDAVSLARAMGLGSVVARLQ